MVVNEYKFAYNFACKLMSTTVAAMKTNMFELHIYSVRFIIVEPRRRAYDMQMWCRNITVTNQFSGDTIFK